MRAPCSGLCTSVPTVYGITRARLTKESGPLQQAMPLYRFITAVAFSSAFNTWKLARPPLKGKAPVVPYSKLRGIPKFKAQSSALEGEGWFGALSPQHEALAAESVPHCHLQPYAYLAELPPRHERQQSPR